MQLIWSSKNVISSGMFESLYNSMFAIESMFLPFICLLIETCLSIYMGDMNIKATLRSLTKNKKRRNHVVQAIMVFSRLCIIFRTRVWRRRKWEISVCYQMFWRKNCKFLIDWKQYITPWLKTSTVSVFSSKCLNLIQSGNCEDKNNNYFLFNFFSSK